MPSPRLRYLPQLDGLRAVAVVAVVVHHLGGPPATGGRLGVVVFFVLSGYLITSLLTTELAVTGDLDILRFSLRRLLRLYPPLLVAVVGVLLVAAATGALSLAFVIATVVALTYTTNVVMAVFGVFVDAWSHTWTLALEEQFYLVWPLVLSVMTPRRRRSTTLPLLLVATAVVTMVVGALRHDPTPGAVDTDPLTTCGPQLLGCALGLTRGWRAPAVRPVVGLGGLLLVAASAVVAVDPTTARVADLGAAAGSVLLIAHLVTGRGRLVDTLAVSPLTWLGRHSYEIYLWHYPLAWLTAGRLPGPVPAAVVSGGSLLAAWASRRFVSGPLDARWKQRLTGAASPLGRPSPG